MITYLLSKLIHSFYIDNPSNLKILWALIIHFEQTKLDIQIDNNNKKKSILIKYLRGIIYFSKKIIDMNL